MTFLQKVQEINALRSNIIQEATKFISNEINLLERQITDIINDETLRNDENYQSIYDRLKNIKFVSETLGIEYCMPFTDYRDDYDDPNELSRQIEDKIEDESKILQDIWGLLDGMEGKSKQWYGSLAQEC